MLGLFDNASVLYDIDDAKIFESRKDGTVGTKYDVPSINLFRIEYVSKNAMGRGDGGVTTIASAIESANITMANVSIADSILSEAMPSSQSLSGVSPNEVMVTDIEAGLPYPYFGMLVRIFDNEEPTGGTIYYVPRMKVMGNITWEHGDNVIVTPEITAMAIRHPSLASMGGKNRFIRMFRYKENMPTLEDFVIPA